MAWSWIRPGEELLRLAQEPAYAPVVQTMRENVEYWKTHFEDSPDRKPGWGHNYVCPHCASQLVYDRDKPLEHRCSGCGAPAENSPLILEAWTYYRRYEIAETLVDAAVLYRMAGDPSDRDFVFRVIDYYAGHYTEFEEYGLYAGRGKVMGQSLCEAVWGDFLLKALIVLDFDGKSALGKRWHAQLFLPASRLVVAQTGSIHNIPLWHASFALGAGLLFGDERLIRQTMGGDLGTRNQILKGFTPDGIWYENSTGYHYYSLCAAVNACLFLRHAGREEPALFERVLYALVAFLKLRFRNDIMPSFNDGWRASGDVGLHGRTEVYLEAARLFEGFPGAEALAAAATEFETRGTKGDFLFGRPEARPASVDYGSVHLASNCIGVLRSPGMEVFFKYGNLSGSHAHPDALAICIPPFSYDLGTSGYGSPFFRGWYATTLSHSTFAVDGLGQHPVAKGIGTLSEDGTAMDMSVDNAYEGVSAKRSLRLTGSRLEDRLTVDCDSPRRVDWFFHGAGDFACEGELIPDKLPESANGYNHLKNVRRVKGPFRARYAAEGRSLSLAFDALPSGATIYVAETPDNPADQVRYTVRVRMQGMETALTAGFEMGDEA